VEQRRGTMGHATLNMLNSHPEPECWKITVYDTYRPMRMAV